MPTGAVPAWRQCGTGTGPPGPAGLQTAASIEFDLARHCFKGRLDDNSKAPALITQLRSGLRLSVTVAAFNKAAASVRHRDITNRASGLPDVGGWFCRDIAGCSSVARFKSDIITEAAWGPQLPSRCGSHGPGPRLSNEPALSDLGLAA